MNQCKRKTYYIPYRFRKLKLYTAHFVLQIVSQTFNAILSRTKRDIIIC